MKYSDRRPPPTDSADSVVKRGWREGVSRFSILCGFMITDLYWLYVIFMSRMLNPVSVFTVDSRTGLQVHSGHIGNVIAILDWSELRLAALLSLIVFVLAAMVASAAERTFANAGLARATRSASAL